MSKQTLKKGDLVVMHTCMEHDHPDNFGKIWTCRSDEFQHKGHDYGSVFLEGFSGSFSTEFLQIVNYTNEVKRLKEENEQLAKRAQLSKEDAEHFASIGFEFSEQIKLLENQLQDALNTLKWYADGDNWIGQCTDVEIDKGWNAQQAIDRIQGQEGIQG